MWLCQSRSTSCSLAAATTTLGGFPIWRPMKLLCHPILLTPILILSTFRSSNVKANTAMDPLPAFCGAFGNIKLPLHPPAAFLGNDLAILNGASSGGRAFSAARLHSYKRSDILIRNTHHTCISFLFLTTMASATPNAGAQPQNPQGDTNVSVQG